MAQSRREHDADMISSGRLIDLGVWFFRHRIGRQLFELVGFYWDEIQLCALGGQQRSHVRQKLGELEWQTCPQLCRGEMVPHDCAAIGTWWVAHQIDDAIMAGPAHRSCGRWNRHEGRDRRDPQ